MSKPDTTKTVRIPRETLVQVAAYHRALLAAKGLVK